MDIVNNKCIRFKFDSNCFKDASIHLHQHQILAVKHIMTHRGLLLIHSVGSGKTLTAIACSKCYLANYKNSKAIVVTPKSLQGNFIKEMNKFNNLYNDRYMFFTLNGFVNAIINNKISCENSMVIIDEAHNLRTHITDTDGINAKTIIGSVKDAQKVILLTATPIINNIYDMANLISLIDGTLHTPKQLYKNIIETQFKNYFSCKFSVYRPAKKEYDKYYPSSTIHNIYLKMDQSYQKKYEQVEHDIGTHKIFKNPKIFYNGVRRASNKIDNNSSKLEWIKKFIKTKKGKILIFSHWLAFGIELIISQLKEFQIKFLKIDGSLSKAQRTNVVEQYNNNNIQVLIISKAGGEGIDLKGTDSIIIVEPSWNPSTIEQIIGRGVRYKSHYNLIQQHVDIYQLYLLKNNENGHNPKFLDLDNMDYDRMWSIDLYLRAIMHKKEQHINNFIEKLKRLSIENSKCSC